MIHIALCGYSSNHSIELVKNTLAEELQFYFLKYKFMLLKPWFPFFTEIQTGYGAEKSGRSQEAMSLFY